MPLASLAWPQLSLTDSTSFPRRENLIRHKKHHRPQLHICVSCNYKFDNKYELEHHTLLHAEKSFSCDWCEMSFLKRSELARHVNKCHHNDVVQKYGIIDRVSAVGKTQYSPYARRSDDFKGYKTKELIQKKRTNEDDDFDYEQLMYRPNGSVSSKWSVYSVSSSCYSRTQSIPNGFPRPSIEEPTEVDDNEPEQWNGVSAEPSHSLDCFDIFSVDLLGCDESFQALAGQDDQAMPIDDDGITVECIDLRPITHTETNRCLISFSIEIIDKYLPPYDELFEKYLPHSNLVHRSDSNESEDDVQMMSSFESEF